MQETMATWDSAGVGGIGGGVGFDELPQLSVRSSGVVAAMPRPSFKKERRVHSGDLVIVRLSYGHSRERCGRSETD